MALLPLIRVAAHSGSPTWQLPIGVLKDDLVVSVCTGYEPPTPTPEDGTPHLPGHLYLAVTAGEVTTRDGPRPLTWLGYAWVPNDVTSLAGVGSYSFSLPAEYNLGGIPFLQRSVQLVCYRNVKAVLGDTVTSDENKYVDTDTDHHNPWVVGGAGGPANVPLDSAVMGIATANGTVAGHAGADLTGQWTSQGFDQGGRKSVTEYSWVTPGDLDSPDTKVTRPDGLIPITGTRPSGYMVGIGLSRTLTDLPPVVRQYPRDYRGLAAGRRLYPPPRANRIVGGHQ
jgi:hypothetical protein